MTFLTKTLLTLIIAIISATHCYSYSLETNEGSAIKSFARYANDCVDKGVLRPGASVAEIDEAVAKNFPEAYAERCSPLTRPQFPIFASEHEFLLAFTDLIKSKDDESLLGATYREFRYVLVWRNGVLMVETRTAEAFRKLVELRKITLPAEPFQFVSLKTLKSQSSDSSSSQTSTRNKSASLAIPEELRRSERRNNSSEVKASQRVTSSGKSANRLWTFALLIATIFVLGIFVARQVKRR